MDPLIRKDNHTQNAIAVALLLIALIFIPIMLCVKPCMTLC
jgi:hypothetical protein